MEFTSGRDQLQVSDAAHPIHICSSESKSVMTKRQLIDDIRQYNLSVQPQFLAQFDNDALRQYLEHLQSAARKHVRIAGWVKKAAPRLKLVS